MTKDAGDDKTEEMWAWEQEHWLAHTLLADDWHFIQTADPAVRMQVARSIASRRGFKFRMFPHVDFGKVVEFIMGEGGV